jgi:DNA-binding HxlR family transcriptional regulator
MAKKSGINERSIERIENGEKYLNEEEQDKYIQFIGVKTELISSLSFNLTWKELIAILKKTHPKTPLICEITDKKGIPKRIILQRVLPEKLLDKPLTASELSKLITAKFKINIEPNKVQNSLNSLVNTGLLVRTQTSPIKYKRSDKKFPKEIDQLFDLVIKLEQICEPIKSDLVNGENKIIKPSLRKMAIMLLSLVDGEKTRKELFNKANMKNDTNNAVRTVNVLENTELITKTKLAVTSSRQSYKLTDKGFKVLRELEV